MYKKVNTFKLIEYIVHVDLFAYSIIKLFTLPKHASHGVTTKNNNIYTQTL